MSSYYSEFKRTAPKELTEIIDQAVLIYLSHYEVDLINDPRYQEKGPSLSMNDCMALSLFESCMKKEILGPIFDMFGIKKSLITKYYINTSPCLGDDKQMKIENVYTDYSRILSKLSIIFFDINDLHVAEKLMLLLVDSDIMETEIIQEILQEDGKLMEGEEHPIIKRIRSIVDYHKNDKPSFARNPEFSRPIFDRSPSQKFDINSYGSMLTDEKFYGNPAAGRDKELLQLCKYLLTRRKSPLIVGEPGIGKTALVNGLAYAIQNNMVPDILSNNKIFSISATAIVAGTKYRGDLEARAKNIFDYCANQGIILFIDEMHMLVNAGQTTDNNIDVAGILKPYLGTGSLKIIGATTTDEVQVIQSNAAFSRRMKLINLRELSGDELSTVLFEAVQTLEKEELVLFGNDAEIANYIKFVLQATEVSHRKNKKESHNPDIAIEIFEDAAAAAKLRSSFEVTTEDVAEAIEDFERIYPTAAENVATQLRKSKVYTKTNNITPFYTKNKN